MHYFQHNVGDFAQKTRYLTPEEVGVFVLLRDQYAITEKPIEKSWIAFAFQEQCKRSVERVLNLFFKETEDGYFSEEIDGMISAYRDLSEKKKSAAKKRWEKKETESKSNARALQENTDAVLTNNHKPITNNQEPNITATSFSDEKDSAVVDAPSDAVDDSHFATPKNPLSVCPYKEIVTAYHEELPTLPRVNLDLFMSSNARKSTVKARWQWLMKDQGCTTQAEGVAVFHKFFKWVGSMKFLLGENERHWQANFDWLMKQENFNKVCEERYVGGVR